MKAYVPIYHSLTGRRVHFKVSLDPIIMLMLHLYAVLKLWINTINGSHWYVALSCCRR